MDRTVAGNVVVWRDDLRHCSSSVTLSSALLAKIYG